MTTSGSIDFTLTARDIIAFAYDVLGVAPVGSDPSDAQMMRAVVSLNMMLKGWQKYQNLWRQTEGAVTLAADDAFYTLTPTPHKVISARYRNSSDIDMPMNEMTRQEYFDLPQKENAGIPHSYYINVQRDSTVMAIWQPLASVTTETIQYTYQRRFEDIDSLNDTLDVLPEWLEVVGYNLAVRLAPRYPDARPIFNEIKAQAETLKQDMLDDDREAFIRFIPAGIEQSFY